MERQVPPVLRSQQRTLMADGLAMDMDTEPGGEVEPRHRPRKSNGSAQITVVFRLTDLQIRSLAS